MFQCSLCCIQCIQFKLGLLGRQGEETGVVYLRLQGIKFGLQLFQSGRQIIQLQLQLVRELTCFFRRLRRQCDRLCHFRRRCLDRQLCLLQGTGCHHVGITTHIIADPAIPFKQPATGDSVVDEATIVADQQQSARVIRQQLFQQFQRFDIQIVGWFIQNQQVTGFEEQLGQQ
ncbi:hypothetical protein D3C84_273050 [compost metagenome]